MKKIILFFICSLIIISCYCQNNLSLFGSTKASIFTFKGDIYAIENHSFRLPKDYSNLEKLGTIYTDSLNVPKQEHLNGFPGATKRTNWYSIVFNGNIYISEPGLYYFVLQSDDGSKLFIDNNLIINHDGNHGMTFQGKNNNRFGKYNFNNSGIYPITVQYYQGPSPWIGLILKVSRDNEIYKTLKLSEFMPVEITNDGETLSMSFEGGVLFDINSVDLSHEAKLMLYELIIFFNNQNEYKSITIEGHTDDLGDESYNYTLGNNRAKAVKNYLISKDLNTIDIKHTSYGETKPKYPNDGNKNRKRNRRIEIILNK